MWSSHSLAASESTYKSGHRIPQKEKDIFTDRHIPQSDRVRMEHNRTVAVNGMRTQSMFYRRTARLADMEKVDQPPPPKPMPPLPFPFQPVGKALIKSNNMHPCPL